MFLRFRFYQLKTLALQFSGTLQASSEIWVWVAISLKVLGNLCFVILFSDLSLHLSTAKQNNLVPFLDQQLTGPFVCNRTRWMKRNFQNCRTITEFCKGPSLRSPIYLWQWLIGPKRHYSVHSLFGFYATRCYWLTGHKYSLPILTFWAAARVQRC